MSVEAITWALAQRVDRSSAKFVLVAMANCAGADMLCWPSVAYLVEATCQDRKTVLENMKRLRDAGYITPTDAHKGKTGQVAVYRLTSPENGTVKESQKRDIPKTGPVPKTDANSTVFPSEESRFSVETVPKTGHGTVKEPSIEPSGNQKRKKAVPETVGVEVLVEAGFDPATAEDFIAHKASVKAPLTQRAWADHLRESAKAGWTPMQAAEKVMAKGWKGFEAKYVANEARSPPGGVSRQTALEARNRAVIEEYLREQHEPQ
jgi:pyocin large subunit-like protein